MFESCRAHFAALGRPPSRGKGPALAESSGMAEAPDGLTLRRHRGLVGRERRPLLETSGKISFITV
jgi:hypothetical protein